MPIIDLSTYAIRKPTMPPPNIKILSPHVGNVSHIAFIAVSIFAVSRHLLFGMVLGMRVMSDSLSTYKV